jgi:hypothetical protein
MLRRLLAEPTFAVNCRMESNFLGQVLVETAMSCAESIGHFVFGLLSQQNVRFAADVFNTS